MVFQEEEFEDDDENLIQSAKDDNVYNTRLTR